MSGGWKDGEGHEKIMEGHEKIMEGHEKLMEGHEKNSRVIQVRLF